MRINFVVEDLLFFKYVGCSTAARMLFRALQSHYGIEVGWNSWESDFDIVHFHTFGPRALFYRRIADGIKVVTAHSTPRLNRDNLAFSGTINLVYPRIYRSFDHIVALSEYSKREVEMMAPGVPVSIIPNGVDRSHFRYDSEGGRRFRERFHLGDRKMVLTVAQITPRKGIYDFLELAARYPEIAWVWVGGFPYGPISKEYLKIRHLMSRRSENVIFTGFVEEIRDAYSAADLFFMPSYAEGMSIVLLEALSMGLPCVVRDIPEFREIFGDEGLYFRNAQEAGRIIASDEELYRMRMRARDLSEKFDIDRVARQHLDLYRGLIEA